MPAKTSSSRLDALYADFSRQMVSNPTAFEENAQWWTRYLAAWTRSQGEDRLSIRIDQDLWTDLKTDPNGIRRGRPLGLPIVVAREVKKGAWIREEEFARARSWTTLLRDGLLWFAPALKPSDNVFDNIKGTYVVLEHVEEAQAGVLKKRREMLRLRDDILSKETFQETFADCAMEGVTLSQRDINILIRHLERQNILAVQGEVIKFQRGSTQTAIDEIDRGILAIKQGQDLLQKQIESIRHRQQECQRKIQENLSRNKELSMLWLKSKKSLEHLEKARWDSYHNLENLLSQIEQAIQDAEIVQAYKTSSETLQTILNQKGLQPSYIESTMDKVASTLSSYAEVQDAIDIGQHEIQRAAGRDPDTQADEMEDELAQLIKEVELEDKKDSEPAPQSNVKSETDNESLPIEELPVVPSNLPSEPQNSNASGQTTIMEEGKEKSPNIQAV